MELGELTLADFEPCVGDVFAIAEPEAVGLVLESATLVAERPGGREPFSLVFAGPREPLLAQSIQRLEHAGLGALEIFVVPIGRDEAACTYEAIFT